MLARRHPERNAILLGSGAYFDCFSPETSAAEVTDEDVAYGLAFTARFRGQTINQATGRRCLYTVAEHCVRASYIAEPEYAYAVLMHELGEVIWGDVTSPQKSLLPTFRKEEHRCHRQLAKRFDVEVTNADEIKRVDLIMLATERRDLMPPTVGVWPMLEGVEPLPQAIMPYHPHDAAEMFLARMRELNPTVAAKAQVF